MKQYKVGLFPMVGDLLHVGHIWALFEAKQVCDKLIVAINERPEGKTPVQSGSERAIQALAVRFVDNVILYKGREELEAFARVLDYDVRFLGDDYIGKDWDGKAQETKRGIEPYFISRNHGYSSTELKERIIANHEKQI